MISAGLRNCAEKHQQGVLRAQGGAHHEALEERAEHAGRIGTTDKLGDDRNADDGVQRRTLDEHGHDAGDAALNTRADRVACVHAPTHDPDLTRNCKRHEQIENNCRDECDRMERRGREVQRLARAEELGHDSEACDSFSWGSTRVPWY
jgi:hypothetical protein